MESRVASVECRLGSHCTRSFSLYHQSTVRTSFSSSTSERESRKKWAAVSARTPLPAGVRAVADLLEDPDSWRLWLPGLAEGRNDEEPDGEAKTKDRRFHIETEFFKATVELDRGPDGRRIPDGLPGETGGDGRGEFLLEGSELRMGPIERFQVILRLLRAPGSRPTATTSPGPDDNSCTAEMTVRWRGNIPYFGVLFKPLFASYFRSFARQSLKALAGFTAEQTSEELCPPDLSRGKTGSSQAARATMRSPTRRSPLRGHPWWAPPEQLSVGQTRALAALCFYGMVMGFMTSLAGIAQHQIIESFHADDAALGRMFFFLGIGSLPGIFLLPFGDRVGRRKILMPALVITAIASGLSAFAPTLGLFTTLQTLVRAPLFVALSLAWIYLVEEMPTRGRAYAISVFTMTGGLGGGIGLLSLPWVQRISASGWRLLFAAGLLALLAVPALARDLPETRRFESAWHGANPLYLLRKPHLGRILILLGAALAASVYGSPAARFQGRYIQNALGYTPGLYVIFTVVTTLPAAPGMLLGGRLADTVGRKTVGILAASVGAVSQALLYWLSGPALWISSAIGSFVGAMWIPAMGSFSTELFPTSLRANASSATSVAGMAGGAAGSWLAGYLIVTMGSYGGAITALLPAALISGFLVLLLFPETKGKELHDISPELQPPPEGLGGGFLR